MKRNLLFTSILISLFCIVFTSCSKDEDGNNKDENGGSKTTGYAPQSLQVGYKFLERYIESEGTARQVIKILSATQLRCSASYDINNYFINTSYSYTKTGDNTANFSYGIQQYINGPVRNRRWENTGVITFTSEKDCTYSYTVKYYADGVYTLTETNTVKWRHGFIDGFNMGT